MDIQELKEGFEDWFVVNYHDGDIHPNHHLLDFKECDQEYVDDLVNMLWEAWQAAKASVTEGFVLVDKSKIKTWYQDDSEPENYCYEADSLDDLGDCLDNGDIIQVNKIEEAIIQTTPLFGVWKFKLIGGQVERDRFVLCSSEVEASAVRDEYRRMLGLQAQGQSDV